MLKKEGKTRYVKVTAEDADTEWYTIGFTRGEAKWLADQLGMPALGRTYTDVYLTDKQYKAIPELDV